MRRFSAVPGLDPAFLCGALVALVACGSEDTPDQGGLHVEDLPDLVAEEELRLGSVDDPDIGFSSVVDLAVDEGGQIYVAESLSREVRVYDPEGNRVGSIGRSGEGPGEYRRPSRVGFLGDTVFVYDAPSIQRFQINLYGAEGEFYRSFSGRGIDVVADLPGVQGIARPWEPRPDGLWTTTMAWMRNSSAEVPDSIRYPEVLFDGMGEAIDTVGFDWMSFGGAPVEVDGVSIFVFDPLPSGPLVGTVGLHEAEVARPVAGSSDRGVMTVVRHAPDGDTLHATELGYRPLPVEAAYVDSVLTGRAERYVRQGMTLERAQAALRELITFPPFHPPATRLNLGEDGTILIRREDPGTDRLRWLMIEPDGRPRGEFDLPRSAILHWAREDWIWVVERDELDVPWVVRYRIREGG